jgi:translocator protein
MTELASARQLRASLLRWVLVCVPACLLLGFLSGQLADSGPRNPWFATLIKPDVYPAPGLFGIVWSILYVLMGIALAMVITARGAELRRVAIAVFGVQFALNLSWSPVFFGMHRMETALYILGAMVIAVMVTIALFLQIRKVAALLMFPLLLWVMFATYLNWGFYTLNPQSDGRSVSGAVTRFEI